MVLPRKLKIVVTGVECSGKTTLCKDVAAYFKTDYIPEYARSFLMQINRPYVQQDLTTIAVEQQAIQNNHHQLYNLTICDTDASVIKIWSDVKYGSCDIIIEQLFAHNMPDLYILPYYDIPYEQDTLRETSNLEDREQLFYAYANLLEYHTANYIIVKGSEEERLALAIKAIEQL